jgi:hypothetical protein
MHCVYSKNKIYLYLSPFLPLRENVGFFAISIGEVAEWPNAHAWKVCLPQGNVGSNPTLSASLEQERERERRGLALLLFLSHFTSPS